MTLSELFDKADEMVAKRYSDCNASIKEMNSYRDGYIHGMTEKLEGMIPIEEACECLIKLHNWPTQYEEYAKLQEEFIKEFRKAMGGIV